jgi:hypothetical protein
VVSGTIELGRGGEGEWVTFVIENAAVFQGEYVGFAVLQLTKVVGNFQTLQVPCRKNKSAKKKTKRE